MKILLSFLLLSIILFANVDINHANLKELTTLKGIGAKTAQKILEYREKNGCFSSIEELVKVKGVGTKTLEKNRANLEAIKCEMK